jgi:hypothetical protein
MIIPKLHSSTAAAQQHSRPTTTRRMHESTGERITLTLTLTQENFTQWISGAWKELVQTVEDPNHVDFLLNGTKWSPQSIEEVYQEYAQHMDKDVQYMDEESTRTRMLKYMVRAKDRIESECKLVKKIYARIGKSLLGAISPEVRTELQCHPMYRYNIWLDPFALLKLLGDVSIRFRDDNPMIKAQRQISIENQVRSFKLEANESTLDCLTRYTHLIRECEMRGADLPDPMKQVIIFSNAMKEASRGVTYTKDADD